MSNVSREHVEELWRRMAAIFGHQWTSSYGESDSDDTWFMALQNFTAEELSRGLNACATMKPGDGEFWPPNLPEFRAMCRPAPKPAYHDEYKGLPAPKISKEDALEHVRKIREALKHPNKEET